MIVEFNQATIETLIPIIKEAGEIAKDNFLTKFATSTKADNTLVTEIDLEINHYLNDALKKAFPGTGLVTEELEKTWEEYTWTIDPIDGTSNYVYGKAEFVVMVGLIHREEASLGIIYNPISQELYYGGKSVPPMYTDSEGQTQLIQLLSNLETPNIVIGSSTQSESEFQTMYPDLKYQEYLQTGSEGRRLMTIVQGKSNVRIESQNRSYGYWDLCPPQAILEAVGAKVVTREGTQLLYGREEYLVKPGFIVASHAQRLQQIIAAIEK